MVSCIVCRLAQALLRLAIASRMRCIFMRTIRVAVFRPWLVASGPACIEVAAKLVGLNTSFVVFGLTSTTDDI